MPVKELTCQELVEVVTDYLEGTLPPDERIQFEKHLVACDGCAIYLEQMKATIRLTGLLREEEVAPDALETLLTAFRGWRRAK